jgi:hypothetical protein
MIVVRQHSIDFDAGQPDQVRVRPGEAKSAFLVQTVFLTQCGHTVAAKTG